MRARERRNPRDAALIRNRLADSVTEARARGDDSLVLDVGSICEDAGVEDASGYAICCDVLDSERFARDHVLWYHHRTGAWGTGDASYTFLLNKGTKAPSTPEVYQSPWRWVKAVLFLLIAVAVAGVIWGVLLLV